MRIKPESGGGVQVTTNENFCRSANCHRHWTICGYCRQCWEAMKRRKDGPPGDPQIARENLAKIKSMMGDVFKKLPYDPRKRHA